MNTANGIVGRVLARFESVKRSGKGWKTRCPCHDDRVDSLMIDVGDDGRALLHCHAGCSTNDIVGKIGLVMSDLMPENSHADNGKPKIVATYDYRDEAGELLYQVCRFEPKTFRQRKPKNGGGWEWKLGDVRRVLYRLPELREAIEGAGENPPTVFVVEGEKDCDRLRSIGLVATCNAGGAGKWLPAYDEQLAGCLVCVIPDNDDAGRDHARLIPAQKILELPGLPPKGDVSDWLDAGGTAQQLLAMAEAAPDELPLTDDELRPIPFGQLADENPRQDPPLVHGLLRSCEVANAVSNSKVGKSWMSAELLMRVITGQPFLGQFDCMPGRVLLIDNELRRGTIVYRINKVAEALEVPDSELRAGLDVLSLRGQRIDLFALARLLGKIKPDTYQLVIADAFYRLYPAGFNENDNPATMALYNEIDAIVGHLNCAWLNVHHASKGQQGDKRKTDVGSGAGAQSRAADSHLILREHEDEGAFVFDAVVRSFAPIEPIGLRWEFPVWRPDESLDTSKLKGKLTATERKQKEKDVEGIGKLAAALADGPATKSILRGKTGFGASRLDRLLDQLEAAGSVRWTEKNIHGNVCREYEATDQEKAQ